MPRQPWQLTRPWTSLCMFFPIRRPAGLRRLHSTAENHGAQGCPRPRICRKPWPPGPRPCALTASCASLIPLFPEQRKVLIARRRCWKNRRNCHGRVFARAPRWRRRHRPHSCQLASAFRTHHMPGLPMKVPRYPARRCPCALVFSVNCARVHDIRC